MARKRHGAEQVIAKLREAEADDAATGLRGLRTWTELAADEDWSAYYPDSLRTPGRSAQ